MSCPDWQRLTALRERDPDAEPPGWREALAHLDGCPACAAAALAADPLLVFRRLPRPAVREAATFWNSPCPISVPPWFSAMLPS